MVISEAVSKRINELLSEKGWSLYKLSKESCVPPSTLKNIYNGHTKSPTLAVIYQIADAFGMTPIEFLNHPIFDKDNIEYM